MNSFWKLEDFLLPLPLPAIVAVLMVCGFKYLGSRLIRQLHIESPPPIQSAAAFILVVAGVGEAAFLLSWAGVAYYWLLRTIAWSLVGLGLVELSTAGRKWLTQICSQIKSIYREQAFWGKAALIFSGITGAGLLLAALGPPTDADSLDYHLGVPLDILRHHGVFPRADWFFARMTGLGEYLNMVGLAGGTDILGACLQVAGMVLAIVAVTVPAKDNLDKILLAMAVIGCPVMAFLVPNQKPLMLPAAATTIAIILLAQRYQNVDRLTLAFSFGCACFAMSCKYPFLLSGAVVVGVGLWIAHRSGLLRWGGMIALMGYLVLVFPLQLKNYLFYGDPLSPLLERFRHPGDAALDRFSSFHSISHGSSWPLPLNLIIPDSLGSLTIVLGIGVLLFFLAIKEIKKPNGMRIILVSALLISPFTLVLSSIEPRYFLEPYLWIITVAALTAWSPAKKFIFKLLVGQVLLTALVAVYGAVALFPGALTSNLRDSIMSQAACGYETTKWLNKVLPIDSVVLADIRFVALMPRPFVSRDFLVFADLDDPSERAKVLSILRLHHINTLVLSLDPRGKMITYLNPYLSGCIAGPHEFKLASRNPWNRRGSGVQLVAYYVNFNHSLSADGVKQLQNSVVP